MPVSMEWMHFRCLHKERLRLLCQLERLLMLLEEVESCHKAHTCTKANWLV